MGVMLGALHRAGADVLLLHKLPPDAAGTVGVRMTPTEGAVRCGSGWFCSQSNNHCVLGVSTSSLVILIESAST